MNCACPKHGEYGILPLLPLLPAIAAGTALYTTDPAGIFSSDDSTEEKITEEIQKEQIEDASKRQAASGGASPDQAKGGSFPWTPVLIGAGVLAVLTLAAGGGYLASR